ncbi:MAG: hypothetical protein EOM03_17380, partial [Clostridia bacterium]|nr:hypothetical protein [Clostridia bacterium]
MRFREWCLHYFPHGTFSQNDTQYLCKNHLRGDTNASLSFTTKDGGKYNDFGGEQGQVKFFCHQNGLPTWEGADEWKEAAQAAPSPSRDNSALRLWEASQPATSHPYATRKGISVEGLRVSSAGELLVPCYDASGEIVAVERISSNGDKKSLGPKKGAYHVIGGKLDEDYPLLV